MTVNAQTLFDEKDYTGTYPYVADHVIGPYKGWRFVDEAT